LRMKKEGPLFGGGNAGEFKVKVGPFLQNGKQHGKGQQKPGRKKRESSSKKNRIGEC